jgi:hypothetical protein
MYQNPHSDYIDKRINDYKKQDKWNTKIIDTSHEDFIKDFETEQGVAAAFKARNERYKFSNNYFYEYDDDIKLWKIILNENL